MFKKMKTRKRLAALITLITLFAFSSVMTVMTAAQEASLVTATLTTDKESYDEGENVNIALTVKNGNIYGIDKVKSEIGLPDGLTLKKGELTDGEYTLAAGQSRSNEITAYIEKASKPGDTTDPVNPGNPETDGSLCPLWLTLSILSGGTLAVLGIKKMLSATQNAKSGNPRDKPKLSGINQHKADCYAVCCVSQVVYPARCSKVSCQKNRCKNAPIFYIC